METPNAPTPPKNQISEEAVRQAAAAAAEVLNGASAARILELMEPLLIAKKLLGFVASGELVIGQVAPAPIADAKARKK
jgi:hypothetical protein